MIVLLIVGCLLCYWVVVVNVVAVDCRLFVVPGFSMCIVEQSLLYNRRRNDNEVVCTGVDNTINYIGQYFLHPAPARSPRLFSRFLSTN